MAVSNFLRLLCVAFLVKCIHGFDICDFIGCGPIKKCVSYPDSSFECKCPSHLTAHGDVCIGDLCEGMKCGPNQVCKVSKSTGLAECVCDEGYSLLANPNRCIKCPKEKSFISCAPSCPRTCDSIISGKPTFCTGGFVCRPNVHCICRRGYVEKSASDSTCVKVSACKDPCRNVRCFFNSECVDGKCECKEGFVKKGFFCMPDACRSIKCQRNSQCKDGKCVCDPGYQFDSRRRCVKVSETCVLPKVSTRCAPKCSPTCDNPIPRGRCRYTCDKSKKCVCRRGYLERSSTDSTCVKPSDCTAKCPSPKVPTQCATFCPATCDNLNPGPCIFACNTRKKCICPDGMVERSSTDSTCVPKSLCGGPDPCANCPPNSQCISRKCVCNPGFEMSGGKCVQDPCFKCPFNSQCINKQCVCNPGLVLSGGRCVPDPCGNCPANSQCIDKKCQCNRGFVFVDKKCVEDKCSKCPANSACVDNNCVCNPGFMMQGGKCVLPDDPCQNCPDNSKCVNKQCVCNDGFQKQGNECVRSCPTNKVYTKCASTCPKTCKTRDIDFPTSCDGCRPVNCVCKSGYVEKNFGNSECVKISDCPARDPCDFIHCHENSICDSSAKACVCRPGFQSTGFRRCTRIP